LFDTKHDSAIVQ